MASGRDDAQKEQPHQPALLPNSSASRRYLCSDRDPTGVLTGPMHSLSSSRQRQQYAHQMSARRFVTSPDSQAPEQAHPDQVRLLGSPSLYAITPREYADAHGAHHQYRSSTDVGHDEDPEPARKRCKLVDTGGWVEKTLTDAASRRESTGEADPFPHPLLTPPSGRSNSSRHQAPVQYEGNPSPRYLSPGESDRSPGLYSSALSRRSSPLYSSGTPTHSPVPSQATVASTTLRGSPSGSVTGLSGFSELDLSTRANSAVLDGGDDTATFNQIHDVPQVVLPPRETPSTSKLEQLPMEIFMRIMMYCGYKEHIFLKQCNYDLYHTVDLDTVPWEKRMETILFEERYNPSNFPKGPTKDAGREEDEAVSDEEVGIFKKSTTGKSQAKAVAGKPEQNRVKLKAHPNTNGRWGCYCCFKILPAYYFEGSLLEYREGRKAKNHQSRGHSAADSDKKVDMHVEYIQILGPVAGRALPGWLMRDRMEAGVSQEVDIANIEAYMRERMGKGVNCDDLRAYYKGITRETHLVAPLRDVNPVFTPASEDIPKILSDRLESRPRLGKVQTVSGATVSDARLAALPAARSEEASDDLKPYRPLYKLPAKEIVRGATESASYTYEIKIPKNAAPERTSLPLPTSQPVGRICLPQQDSTREITASTLQTGDVVSLRRVCIPCGAKFAAYRRDCNRKIASKTSEEWWVCDCPQVRLAGRDAGCPTCKRKTIY